LPQGEQHSGERANMDVWAGPLAKQECDATRWRRPKAGRRLGVAPLSRRARRVQEHEQPGHRRIRRHWSIGTGGRLCPGTIAHGTGFGVCDAESRPWVGGSGHGGAGGVGGGVHAGADGNSPSISRRPRPLVTIRASSLRVSGQGIVYSADGPGSERQVGTRVGPDMGTLIVSVRRLAGLAKPNKHQRPAMCQCTKRQPCPALSYTRSGPNARQGMP